MVPEVLIGCEPEPDHRFVFWRCLGGKHLKKKEVVMNKSLLKKMGRPVLAGLLFLLLSVPFAPKAHALDVAIDVAPNIINVGGLMESFVIHTNIPYGLVDPDTVKVNGVPLYAWKMDSLGLFDAIVLLSDIEGTLEVGVENPITLDGITSDSEYFSASEDVLIIDKAIKPGLLRK